MWWLEDWFPAGSPCPKGGVAPLRRDIELARYLEKRQEQRALDRDAITTSSILSKPSAAAQTGEMSHGVGFGIADALANKP